MTVKKIALEEHFMAPDFVDYWSSTFVNISPDLSGKALGALSDFGARRLDDMDANGIEFAVLGLAGPGVQIERDTALAVKRARQVNDFLVEKIALQPKRYGGLAHLAMQDPEAAASELERCVRQLGFSGAMINGATNGVYLDDPRYEIFWERAAALDAPVYIHPNNPADHPAMFEGHSELWGPVWSWGVETATHALRLVFAGVFERHPNATLVLGHMGEAIPFQLWRLDSRWEIANRKGRTLAKPPSAYIRGNIMVTTSGVCSDEPLQCAISALGADRVMFSADYPFERTVEASHFIEAAAISDDVRQQICWDNAKRVLNLKI
ncbi:MAG: amidohydrolase family protein [Beijerinckiaceae bacterium]|jgi:2,3-dihydroxybenzoate decarboxylase|nr:amidohydrolase family protein [Beijerinckiaceae bacterium]